jgi:diguanylate cyclase (GGDEF)-like protein/PAS domain S-box-containing protein
MANTGLSPAERESQRQRALDELQILDTQPEAGFDELTRLASLYFDAPMALVSLIDRDRQWFKSRVGVDVPQTPRDIAFCNSAIESHDVMVVDDARNDPRFANSPLVVGEPGIRFYAGAPLISHDGHALGTLCVMDRVPRSFNAEQREILASLSRQVIAQMELRCEHDRLQRNKVELQKTKAQLELVLKGTNDGWWDRDLATGVIYFSERTLEMLGHRQRDLPTDTDLSPVLFPEEDLQHINNVIREAVRGGNERFSVELHMRHKDDHLIPVVCRGYITRDETGWATRISGMMTDVSEFKRSQKAHEESQESYRQLFENSMDGVILGRAEDGAIFSINRAACDMLGRTAEEVIRGGREIFVDFADPRVPNLFSTRARDGSVRGEMNFLRADGTPFECEVSSVLYKGADGKLLASTLFRDITARKRAEAELRIAATAFESHEGIFVCDADWTILRVNRAFTKITGYSSEETLGKSPRHLLGSNRTDSGFYIEMAKSLHETGTWHGEVWDRHKNGTVYPVWLIVTALRGDEGEVTHYVATMTEISDRKKAEEEIRHLAFYDSLTGLPNRRLLLDRLGQALNTSARHKRKGALLFLDLDNFKVLNDTRGHDMGDRLLQQVAQRLVACVRDGDTVARLGGDEFVVMLLELNEGTFAAATQAEHVGEKILESLNQPYVLGDSTYLSTPSIGVTLLGDQKESTDELLKRADLAMYEAKAAGRNTLCFFDAGMQSAISNRVALESDLREALVRQEFLLHYQAQVDVAGHVEGAEVLIRWRHPQRGMVSPTDFIPVAEETGAILPIGTWVLESACRQIALWGANPSAEHLTISVNISGRQLMRPDFVITVKQILKDTGANPSRLKLELTESVLVSDVQNTIAKMKDLQSVGVGFSMDDFGTGYSSLAFLKLLPLNQLKIDQGFVRDILVDSNDAAIAKMVIALADSLGLSVIAEGVETLAQKEFLAAQGCHSYQGYLFGKPMSVTEFEATFLVDPASHI